MEPEERDKAPEQRDIVPEQREVLPEHRDIVSEQPQKGQEEMTLVIEVPAVEREIVGRDNTRHQRSTSRSARDRT